MDTIYVFETFMNDKFRPPLLPRLPGENGLPFDLHEVKMFDICLIFGELFTGRDGDAEMKRRFGAGNFSSVILLLENCVVSFFFAWTDGDGKLVEMVY